MWVDYGHDILLRSGQVVRTERWINERFGLDKASKKSSSLVKREKI